MTKVVSDPAAVAAAVAADIASQLQETNPVALAQIERFIQQVGAEAARALLAETQQVEAQGGLLVRDGSRRRTPGGVFLYLAKSHLSKDQRREVFLPVPRPARTSTWTQICTWFPVRWGSPDRHGDERFRPRGGITWW